MRQIDLKRFLGFWHGMPDIGEHESRLLDLAVNAQGFVSAASGELIDMQPWDITQAKAGDFLTIEFPYKQMFIYSGVSKRYGDRYCVDYLCRIYDGEFYLNTYGGYMGFMEDQYTTRPATVKERNSLLYAMERNGCRWNEKECTIEVISHDKP